MTTIFKRFSFENARNTRQVFLHIFSIETFKSGRPLGRQSPKLFRARSLSMRWLMTIVLVSFVAFCIAGIPSLHTDPIPHSLLSWIIYISMYFSQNILFSFVLGILLFPIFYFTRWDGLKILLSLPMVSFAWLFSFMNAKVFAFWRLYVNSALLDMYFSKGGGSQIFEVHNVMYFWIVGVAVAFVVVGFVVLLISRRLQIYFHFKPCFFIAAFFYTFTQIGFMILCSQNQMPLLQYAMKVPYFYDLSWVRGLEKTGTALFPTPSETNVLQAILSDHQPLHYPRHPLKYHLQQHPLNVLIIMVDSLRYDMVNAKNMPTVAHFAAHADQFLDNQSGGDCTQPGVFSLFYGIPPTYWHAALLHRQESILVRAFQDNHYHLGVFGSASLLSPPFDNTVFADVKHLQIMTPGKTPLDRDREITLQMQAFLNNQAKIHHPFFGFMFYDAPHAYNALTLHTPFSPIGFINYFSINGDTPPAPFFNLYQNAVFQDDHWIADVLQTLRQNHLMQNTIVIITADHGQEFNDDQNNYWEHASGFSKYQIRTPLLIAWPNRLAKIFHYPTSHFDITPTLLKRVLGVTNPVSDYSVGVDIFSHKQPKFIIAGNYAYYALITQHNIMQFHDSGLYRFTDLKMNPMEDVHFSQHTQDALQREMTMFFRRGAASE